MKIELKNLRYSERETRETPCFSTTVYIDGVRAFETENAGHGGGNFNRPVSKEGQALLKTACDFFGGELSLEAEIFGIVFAKMDK